MSDIFWVGLIAALSGLIGAAISGIVTYTVTKRQTDIQAKILIDQLQHQAEEARRDRMVEARRPHLAAIGETLSRLYGAYASLSGRTVNLYELNQRGIPTDDPNRQLVHSQAQDAVQLWIQEVNVLESILAQLSDSTLISLVDDFTKGLGQMSHDEVDNMEALAIEMTQARERLKALRPKLILVNTRIEELLSGDDST